MYRGAATSPSTAWVRPPIPGDGAVQGHGNDRRLCSGVGHQGPHNQSSIHGHSRENVPKYIRPWTLHGERW
eukprot:5927185-Pyramimonas_sp.AAC.1